MFESTLVLPMWMVREMCDPNIPLGGRVASKLYPARDYVMIELEEQRYQGTLVIPDSAKDAPVMGVITAVGPGIPGEDKLVSKIGDRVFFARYSGADLEWEGKNYLLIRESEIICYVGKEDSSGERE